MEESGTGRWIDLLMPLKAALDRVVELAQLVEGFELVP
jgi:hypothetical protein